MTNPNQIALEIKITEQEESINKLSDEAYLQHKRIDQLEKKLHSLTAFIKNELSNANQDEVPDTPPPHY